MKSEYFNLSQEMVAEMNRGSIFYVAIELYLPFEDDIYNHPENAQFRFSDSRFFWRGLKYQDKIAAIPALDKFVSKEFNTLQLELANVERLIDSGSRFAFSQQVRGYRVAVRIIFPGIVGEGIEHSRLIWWGRLSNIEGITSTGVKVNCTQEIGDFSYELATQKYGSACPLWFGKGDCLGDESLTDKSAQFQDAFARYGQGGCNRTEKRCTELQNERFYQGQDIVTVSGKFFREEVTKKKFLFFFTIKKINKIPVQWSSKNQSENSGVVIPRVLGRAKVELHPFTWADTGTNIIALLGGCKGLIEGFYNITCLNANLTLQDVTQHLGEFGGVGTQQLDPRFPQSGYNSKLAYVGATYAGSPPDDSPEETPTTTAVIKGEIVEATDALNEFVQAWSCNPVWLTQHVITNFQYTIIRRQWFNDTRDKATADYCFNIVEDDTDAEQVLVSSTDANNFYAGEWVRYASTGRVTTGLPRAQTEPLP